MTFLDMKKQVVEEAGAPQLVVDAAGGDFSEHEIYGRPKAARLFNKAQQRLENVLIEMKREEYVSFAVRAGQTHIDLPEFRYITRLDLTETGKPAQPLYFQSIGALRSTYEQPWSGVDRSIPTRWTRGKRSADAHRNFLYNDSAGDWTLGADVNWSNRSLVFETGVARTAAKQPWGESRKSFSVFGKMTVSDPDVVVAFLFQTEDPDFTEIVYVGRRPEAITTFQYDDDDTVNIRTVRPTDGGRFSFNIQMDVAPFKLEIVTTSSGALAAVTLSDLVFSDVEGDIIIMPPPDKQYTLTASGSRNCAPLEKDDDESWLSINAPNALMLMVRAYIELDLFGNRSGFSDFEAQAIKEAEERWGVFVFEENKRTPREERRFMPVSFGDYQMRLDRE